MYYWILRSPPGWGDDVQFVVRGYDTPEPESSTRVGPHRFAASLEDARDCIPEPCAPVEHAHTDPFIELWESAIRPDTAKPLKFPVPFADVPAYLVHCNIPRESVPLLLGPPMLTDWVDGLGNADFWAFEYPCGLQLVYRFLHESTGGLISADSPEIGHVLRHLPFDQADCVPIDTNSLQSELELLLTAFSERRAEIEGLYAFQVWHQGDDGNPFKIGDPTSERDAKCLVKHFESLGHKQLYWYSRVDS